ncbi:VPLPA-CTERM-specific exosortase XrtD [Petrachloros mirabilis]
MEHFSDIGNSASPLLREKLAPTGAAALFVGAPRAGLALLWIAGVAVLVLLGFAYSDSLAYLIEQWTENDNYSHGFFVPLIVGMLIWWRREQVVAAGMVPSFWGLALVLGGFGLFILGELATLHILSYLSLWLVSVGLLMAVIGPRSCWELAFPLGYLLTMFPLPQMLEQNLSASLQLASSALGVGCLQVIGITAFREGNVIDLGPIQLQIVEACSGLRYLFPLTSLALLCGYLFQDRLWKKLVLVGSAIPLAIVLNGLRIGMIGVLVEWQGQGAAVGFMHAFEGWIVFVISFAILVCEMWFLARIGGTSGPMILSAAGVTSRRTGVHRSGPSLSAAFAVCILIVAGMTALSFQLREREEIIPSRQSFLDFPMELAGWRGTSMVLERQYVDVLRFDDYLLADYQAPTAGSVNLYVAYYRSQKKGQSAHSPKTCLPGGGWELSSMTETEIAASDGGRALRANRVVIRKGDERQVVLYWFKQRDRLLTDEYMVKAALFWDSLTRRRSDGALVRLIAPLVPGEDEESADRRLNQFAALVEPMLDGYVPD